MIRSTFVLAIAAAFLAACVTTQQHPVTQIQVASGYGLGNSAKNEPRVKLTANTVSTTEALGNPWWQQFGDERLSRLVAKVLEANTDLAVAGLRLKQARLRQKSFDAAVDVERLYEVRYRSGATPLRLWLDAQETRRSAELSLAEARLAQLQNDALLFQALGGGA